MDFDNPKVHGDTFKSAQFFFCNAKNRFCEVKKSDQDAKTAFQSHTCEKGLADDFEIDFAI